MRHMLAGSKAHGRGTSAAKAAAKTSTVARIAPWGRMLRTLPLLGLAVSLGSLFKGLNAPEAWVPVCERPAGRHCAGRAALCKACRRNTACSFGASPYGWPKRERAGARAKSLAARHAAVSTGRDLYEVLDLPKDAGVADIKKAYYREAKHAHPDKWPGDEEMRQRFQTVAEAYQTLADPVRRQHYDLRGLAGLAYLDTNATRLFGPPPWRVLIGRTDHWMWESEQNTYFLGLIASSIPNGIAGVTLNTIKEAVEEARNTRVAVLLDRVSEEQAKDTVLEIEEYGIAVKAEPIEGERSNEKESPLQHFRRIQRELGEASESLRSAAIDLEASKEDEEDGMDSEFEKWIGMVRSLRSELRAAARGLEEFKLSQVK